MNLDVPCIPRIEGVCDTLAAESMDCGALPNSGGVYWKIYVNSFSYFSELEDGF